MFLKKERTTGHDDPGLSTMAHSVPSNNLLRRFKEVLRKTPPRPRNQTPSVPQRPSKPRVQHIPQEPDSPTPLTGSTRNRKSILLSQPHGPDPEAQILSIPFSTVDDDDEDESDSKALQTLLRLSTSDADFMPWFTEESKYSSDIPTTDTPDDDDAQAAELLVLPLHPYLRPKENNIKTLLQLVWATLPPVPPLYEGSRLRKTKRPTLADCSVGVRLSKIVYVPHIFAPIEAAVASRLNSITIDLNNPLHREFATRVFPWHTAIGASRRIQSEVDTEDMVMNVLMRAAMAVAHTVLRESESNAVVSISENRNSDSPEPDGIQANSDPLPDDHDSPFPFLSSAHSRRRAKPDGILVLSGEHPDEITPLCLEVKTHAICSDRRNPLRHVQTPVPGHPHGAYKFNMPRSPSHSEDHTCSILTQIWSQLVCWNANYGILSSMETTTFYARKSDTLYISRCYGRKEETLFYVVCWVLLAIGAIPSLQLNLPKADISWWPRKMKNSRRDGVC
ncbi:hypothetical protein DENSPDRAFT_266098 [Dentipellis sp. KUC8613]|nr:hypothetical protein DENSPDRAFT_266098 [Dentipellis sp. KUC8613]